MTDQEEMEEANAKDVWRAALGELELQVTKPYFETYLKGTSGLSLEGDRFAVAAPNSFVTEWLRLKMKPRVEETLAGLLGRPVSVQFLVSSQQGTRRTPLPRRRSWKVRGMRGRVGRTGIPTIPRTYF